MLLIKIQNLQYLVTIVTNAVHIIQTSSLHRLQSLSPNHTDNLNNYKYRRNLELTLSHWLKGY